MNAFASLLEPTPEATKATDDAKRNYRKRRRPMKVAGSVVLGVTITGDQAESITNIAEEEEVSKSEIIRRALDAYLFP